MMDVITGKTRPDEGTVFFGQTIDLTRLSEPEIAHIGIGRKFQKPTIFENHTVFENLELAMKTDKRVWRSLFALLDSAAGDRIAETLQLIRLDGARRSPGRPALARPEAVAGDRHAADAGAEAAAARRTGGRHDRRGNRAHRRTVLSLAGKHSLVVVEHDMAFVKQLGGKVTVLHEGSVLAEGTLEEVQADARVIEVYLGR
jgi:urea transport system ATP-binding protein